MVFCGGIKGSNFKTILLFLMVFVCNVIILNSNVSTYADGSITLNIDTNNLAVNLMSLSSSGDFAKSNNMNISVSTTSTSGYTLGVTSSTSSTDLTNQSDSTKKINSITSVISESTFSTSSTYNNKWGYKPSHLYNSSTETTSANTNFRPLPGAAGEIIAKTSCANGTSPCTNTTDSYNISIGARVNNQTKIGSYVSDTFIITAVTNQTIIQCDSSKLCVQYDGNGLSFPETSSQLPRTVNNVNYNSTTTQAPITKYAHTPNVSDAGEASGTYSSSMDTTDTVTIDGATSLNVTIYYDAESTNWDWVSVYQSPFDISNTNDATVSTTTGNLSGKLSGRNSGRTTTYSSWYTQSYTVSGDTVKFHFRSDSGGNYYGYYAIITGTGTVYERSVSSGEYAVPTSPSPYRFHGWSEDSSAISASSVTYIDEASIKNQIPGNEGEVKTLYAVYDRGLTIKYNPASSSGTGTGTMNDQVIYTNAPQALTSNSFTTPSGMAFKEWNTSPDGSGTSYSNRATYTVPSTTSLGDTKTLYAIWKQGYSITFTMDSNVSSIVVLDSSGTTVGTITSSGQILNLYQGDSYFIKPAFNTRYAPNGVIKTTGEGTITGNNDYNKSFQVGAGTATINVASQYVSTQMQNYSCSNLTNVGSVQYVYDNRDNEVYLIGKLKDNRCWMLENLNIAGGTALSANDTDVTSVYINSFSTSNNLTKSGSAIVLPTSSISGFNTKDYSYVYNSGNKTHCGAYGQNTPCYSYYSWDAATLGSGRGFSDGADAPQSICPKGWKLPKSRRTSESNWQTNSDFYVLAHQYGLDSTTQTYESDDGFYTQAGPGTSPNFLLAGNQQGYGLAYGGQQGFYWSSTSSSSGWGRGLSISTSQVNAAGSYVNYVGNTIRCVLGS